jgi:hypothetical protein
MANWRYKMKLLGPLLRATLACAAEHRADEVELLGLTPALVEDQLVKDCASAVQLPSPELFANWFDEQLVMWVTRSNDVSAYDAFLEQLDTRPDRAECLSALLTLLSGQLKFAVAGFNASQQLNRFQSYVFLPAVGDKRPRETAIANEAAAHASHEPAVGATTAAHPPPQPGDGGAGSGAAQAPGGGQAAEAPTAPS